MGKLSAKNTVLGIVVTVTLCSTIIALVLSLARHYTVDLPYGTQVTLNSLLSLKEH